VLVRGFMTTDILAVAPSDTLQEAALKLLTRGVSGAPVVDDQGVLVGILSETDFLRHLKRLADTDLAGKYLSSPAQSLSLLALLAERGHPAARELMDTLRGAMVSDAMTTKVITANPGDTLEEVLGLLIRSDINRVPVIEGGKVVGIVTRGDVLRVIAKP